MVDINRYLKVLECKNYFREHIDAFIEGFVRYYGEEHRKEIEYKFKNNLLIAYQSPDSRKLVITKAENAKTAELIDEIMKDSRLSISQEDLFDKTSSFSFTSLMPINSYTSYKILYNYLKSGNKEEYIEESYKLAKNYISEITKEEFVEMFNNNRLLLKYEKIPISNRLSIISLINKSNFEQLYNIEKAKCLPLLKKIIPNITEDNIEEYMENSEEIMNLDFLSKKFIKALELYGEFSKEFNPYRKEIEEERQLELDIKAKKYYELIIENIDLIPEDKREGLDIYIKDQSKSYSLSTPIKKIIGSTLMSSSLIEAFSEESEETLNNSNTAWRKKSILDDRINYFKCLGLDLGDNYEDYLNSEEAKKLWPKKESVDKYLESKKRLTVECENDFFKSTKFYKETMKEIEELNLIDKLTSIDARLFTHNTANTFVNPNIIKTEKGYETRSIVVINMDYFDDNFKDHIITHELNHLYELSLLSASENAYTTLCGWDISEEPITRELVDQTVDTTEESDNKRNYELFNEIINELIAQEISKIMKESGVGVFDNPETAKYRGSTSYEYSIFIINEFYNEFKEKIIESRSNGNIDIILDEVGKENFDALNDLFSEFYNHYGGMKIYSVLDDVRNNRLTDTSKAYFDIVDKKNEILERMRKRSKEKHNETILTN